MKSDVCMNKINNIVIFNFLFITFTGCATPYVTRCSKVDAEKL